MNTDKYRCSCISACLREYRGVKLLLQEFLSLSFKKNGIDSEYQFLKHFQFYSDAHLKKIFIYNKGLNLLKRFKISGTSYIQLI